MTRVLSTLLLLVGLFTLTAIHPTAQTTAPAFTPCTNGGLLYSDPITSTTAKVGYHCVDPLSVGRPAAKVTGIPCAPPTRGIILYTELPDGTCLNHIAIDQSGVRTARTDSDTVDSGAIPFFISPIACDPPGTGGGVAVYAQSHDKQCLNVIAVPQPGSIAANIQASFPEPMVGLPITHYNLLYVAVTPTVSSAKQ